MRRRVLVLPAAAALIVALVAYKLTRTYERPGLVEIPRKNTRFAPLFELYDQHQPSKTVRLVSFVGRQPIALVFFDVDGQAGADGDPLVLRLRREYERMHSAGAIVLAVSTALPQENHKAIARAGEFPFPLLSDPGLDVHRVWGRYDEQSGPRSGVFFIDRAGRVEASATGAPQPLKDIDRAIERLTGT